MNKIYETLIIGSGPCGIGCALKLKEAGIDFAVLESYIPGGKVNICPRVDNYPFEKEIPGPDLAMKFVDKLFKSGAEFFNKGVTKLTKEIDLFEIILSDGTLIRSKTVVIATGTKEKHLGLENEDKMLGKGISYCAICDGHFFRNKDIIVVAKGEHAMQEAIYLSNLAKTLYLVFEEEKLDEKPMLVDKLKQKENVKFIDLAKPIKIIVEDKIKGLIVERNNKEENIQADALFPLIGHNPNTDFVSISNILDKDGFIKFNKDFSTECLGLFAGGDVLARPIKQIYLSEHDGQIIAKNVIKYLRG